MPRIKRIIPNGYTTVNNDFVRDTELSLTARGLLITMLSLPDGWNMSGRGLAAILPDGRDKVFSTLKTLEQKGYLKREKIRENGRFVDVEYQFCDSPIFLKENNNEKPSDKNTETSFCEKKNKKKKLPSEKGGKKERKRADFSSISLRKETRDEIVKNLNLLNGGKLEEYVAKNILEKEKCVANFGVSETTFNCIVSIFTDICINNPELRKRMAEFSSLDVALLYEKIKKKKNPKQITMKFFLEESPTLNV